MISTASFSVRFSRLAVTAAVMLVTCAAAVALGRGWPALPVPDHAESFEVGSHMTLDGLPVRISGYVSDRSVAQLSQWYRERVGGQWVENKVGGKTVLGQRRGDHFITVEIEPMLGGLSGSAAKVVTAILDLRHRVAASAGANRDAFGDWAAHLPASSQVLSHLTDSDDKHDSLHLVAVNGQSVAFNAEHFVREFRQMGYRHELGAPAGELQHAPTGAALAAPERLAFSGPDTDAVVVLGRDAAGRSTVVLIINRSKR